MNKRTGLWRIPSSSVCICVGCACGEHGDSNLVFTALNPTGHTDEFHLSNLHRMPGSQQIMDPCKVTMKSTFRLVPQHSFRSCALVVAQIINFNQYPGEPFSAFLLGRVLYSVNASPPSGTVIPNKYSQEVLRI